jgi:hypothetical protein
VVWIYGEGQGGHEVSSPPQALIRHDGRLDVLCCLDDDRGPLTVTAIAARVGRHPAAVAYLLASLDPHGVVKKTGKLEGGEPLYEACLDQQPAWVREAVEAHRTPRADDHP